MKSESVIVIGGGIAGLTAASLLAYEGIPVTLLEAHYQTGGCAGTFKRGKYIFDVGATQVAGLEKGGIHEKIFNHIKAPLPQAKILDPSCLVDLGDGSRPIKIWHDPKKWAEERQKQFPGSEPFWKLCSILHKSNWEFNDRDPILPTRNYWDLYQLIKALRLKNILSGLLSPLSIIDLLHLCKCNNNKRLIKFLDLQLKLYSQESAKKTAALYGATVLQISQYPLGLWHLKGSMQQLSHSLENNLIKNNGNLLLNHKVTNICKENKQSLWKIRVLNDKNQITEFESSDIIFTPPPQSLLKLIPEDNKISQPYKKYINNLRKPSGALVFYGATSRDHLSNGINSHIQIWTEDLDSLFISISQEGDGRAPNGEATIIASVFTSTSEWIKLNKIEYKRKKEDALKKIKFHLEDQLNIPPTGWLHQELATPKSFAFWTGRPNGMVGGLGQSPLNFGMLGVPSRSPVKGLWLCGDSIHPGEGTAGVSQSALMACRQLLATRGRNLKI